MHILTDDLAGLKVRVDPNNVEGFITVTEYGDIPQELRNMALFMVQGIQDKYPDGGGYIDQANEVVRDLVALGFKVILSPKKTPDKGPVEGVVY